MTSVKLRLNKCRPLRNGTYPLVIQIICDRKKKQITTDFHFHESEFDVKNEKILYLSSINTRKQVNVSNEKINQVKEQITLMINRIKKDKSSYTMEDILVACSTRATMDNFFSYMEEQVNVKIAMNKIGTSKAYKSTLNSLKKFYSRDVLNFSEIDSNFVEKYERHLHSRNVKQNTIGFYMRNFRAIFNRWKKDRKESVDVNPFVGIHTKIEKTCKRAVSKEIIAEIARLDLGDDPMKKRARDLFIFSYDAMGMAFIDIMKLKKHNLQLANNSIVYYRAKTNQMVRVPLNEQAKEILRRYMSKESDYLFSFIDPEDESKFYKCYRSELARTNRHLKAIGSEKGLEITLTTYVARHSWATAANNTGAAVSLISASLGHTSVKTTEIYLKELDLTLIKELNDNVTRF